MANSMIEVENLGKMYKLGDIGTGTFSHDLNRWMRKMINKPDPETALAVKNDRHSESNSKYVWSLRDINFQVDEGQILGVIGGNGAGKSTLLKLLSKITTPTTGQIRLDGRVASLLEVGTGFHPELTGRENIFLNGAILGMRRQEIKDCFEEIVEFSGIGRYINTPVKKYSSGMYVRLAFAVAAHLQPDILIVDEVLAVGDAEFQAKCMGKMKDVSTKQGRTVLFVSHNIAAIKQLCNKAILLEKGEQKAIGLVNDIVSLYQNSDFESSGLRTKIPAHQPGYFTDWKLEGTSYDNDHTCISGETCTFSFGFKALESIKNCEVRFAIKYDDVVIVYVSSIDNGAKTISLIPGTYQFGFKLNVALKESKLSVTASIFSYSEEIDTWTSSTKLTVLDNYMSSVSGGIYSPAVQFSVGKQEEPVFL